MYLFGFFFFFQAEDGIRDLVRSRGLGDVYKRQACWADFACVSPIDRSAADCGEQAEARRDMLAVKSGRDLCAGIRPCLLYTSDAADDLLCVDLGGRRIIKKKK